jgi:hypothetical protein
VTALSTVGMILSLLNTGIVGSNPAPVMDVFPRFFFFCCDFLCR